MAAFSMDEIDRKFSGASKDVEAKIRAKVVPADRPAAWDAMDEQRGYSHAKQAEKEEFGLQAEGLNDLFAMPAYSVAGVAAKLRAVLSMGEDSPGDELPWPQIRASMTDLLNLSSGPLAL